MSNIDSNPPVPLAEANAPSPLAKGLAFARLLLRPRLARKLGTVVTQGYLHEAGWVRSVLRDPTTIDATAPEPWATYPFIAFITERLRSELRVFEYGAGSSTLFYAPRVKEVVSVEHDAAFVRALTPHLPANARIVSEAAHSEAYVHAIERAGAPFDLVIVDGRDRVRCAAAALSGLSQRGVLVLDDAERSGYAPARTALKAAGFRCLDFWGLAPGVVGTKSTAVFYRPDNCLGL